MTPRPETPGGPGATVPPVTPADPGATMPPETPGSHDTSTPQRTPTPQAPTGGGQAAPPHPRPAAVRRP